MSKRAAFLNRLQADAGLAAPDDALRAAKSVFRALRDRLTPEEAADLEAQLSTDLKEIWRGSAIQSLFHKATGPKRISFETFVGRVAAENEVSYDRALELTKRTFHLLKDAISPGEVEDVASQLPKKLKILWLEA
jgi:uncharacterized protein (DUF2267 family)